MVNESLCDDSLDIPTPINVPLSAKYKQSFAYATVKDRLPVIITKVIDYLCRDKAQIIQEYGEGTREELKQIIGGFSKLRNELQTNKLIVPLIIDSPDKEVWNSAIKQHESENCELRWFHTPWLLSECYTYRRIREVFEKSQTLVSFDPFGNQKRNAFTSSFPVMLGLAEYLNSLIIEKQDTVDTKNDLFKFFKVALWGNKCDLSLSAGEENHQKIDLISHLPSLENNILVNDLEQVWDILNKPSSTPKIIDIVLDNCGFELFSDLCLADLLVSRGLVSCVQFHMKAIPWFVSDVTLPDFSWTMQQVLSSFPELGARWKNHLDSGVWKLYPIEKSLFWTLPYDFNSMQKIAPELFSVLESSTLVIYKGDLNYRKLVGDLNWAPETPFSTAIRDTPRPLVTLRTLKADVVVGLQPGMAQELSGAHDNWMISGDFAVIQVAHSMKH